MVDQVTFRQTDGTRWGAGKGTPLTLSETDINFWVLLSRIIDIEENPPPPISVANIIVTDSQFKVVLTDATELGPFDLPVATFNYRQDGWLNNTQYFAFDVIPVEGVGLFMALHDHITPVAPAEFDPDAVNVGLEALYQLLFGDPAVSNPTYPAIKHAAFGGI